MTERRREWLYLILGLVIGTTWFGYNRWIDFGPFTFDADAVSYSQISNSFKNFGEAFTYAGNRTFGFPLVLYFIKRIVEVFSNPSPEVLVGIQTATLLVFHFVASVFFYRAIRKLSLLQGLRIHPVVLSLILLHPGLVGHSAVLLTDTFTADLIMIGVVYLLEARNGSSRSLLLRGAAVGLVLGFAVGVRPFLAVSVSAVIAFAIGLSIFFRKPRPFIFFFSPMFFVFSLVLLPSVLNCRTNYGKVCMQNPTFSGQAVSDSLQLGMTFFRYYGSTRSNVAVMPEDWSMVENWKGACNISNVTGPVQWLQCVSRKPLYFPVFLMKKVVALFDSFFLQPYAQDVTPSWARHYSRVFGTLSFVGFFCAIWILLVFIKRRMFWESLAISFPIFTLLFQIPMHIEPRYSFSVVPICLFSLVWLFQWSLRQNRQRKFAYWFFILVFGAIFLIQTRFWDLDDLILQQREAWDRSGAVAGSETRGEKVAELARAEIEFARSPSWENHIALGLALANLGRREGAIEHYERAVELSPLATEAFGYLCMEHNLLRDWDKAIQNCEKALSSAPPFTLASNALQYAKRAKAVEAVVAKEGSAQINLGLLYYSKGAWQSALEVWSQVSASSPYFAMARSNMASAYIMLKDFRSARTVIDEALLLEPENTLFRNNAEWLEREITGAQ